MPMVEALFARCGLQPSDCDAFAYASGPGSFTGLRVACTIVQGLALGAGRPVVAVGHLRALLAVACAAPQPVMARARRGLVMIDARMRQVYWAAYESDRGAGAVAPEDAREGATEYAAQYSMNAATDVADQGQWRECAPPSLCDEGALPALVAAWQPDFIAGAATWLGTLSGVRGTAIVDAALDGTTLVRLAVERFQAGAMRAPELALPEYVRDHVALTVAQRRAGHQPS